MELEYVKKGRENSETEAVQVTLKEEGYDVEVTKVCDDKTVAAIKKFQVDNSEQTRITHNSGADGLPNFSPDGTKIVFNSRQDEYNAIYIMNVDGSNQTKLTHNHANDYQPAFSPDGSKIVFSSDRDGDNREIYIMNSDGTGQTRLTDNKVDDGLPNFSPDGSKIVFNSNRGGNYEIYIMNIDGSEQVNLTNAGHVNWAPAFSPDGSKIVFGSNRDGDRIDFAIYIMNVDGSEQTRLTDGHAANANPNFSPDGSKIVFDYANRDGDNREIYIMNVDGSKKTRLTNNNADDGHPVFSPDGSKIAFTSNRDGNWEIYIMNNDGGTDGVNKPNYIPQADWGLVKSICTLNSDIPYLIAAIGWHETKWGTVGAGKIGYHLGYGYYPGSPYLEKYKGLENQIKGAYAMIRAHFNFPVTQESVTDFAVNHWKSSVPTAWAKSVYNKYISIKPSISPYNASTQLTPNFKYGEFFCDGEQPPDSLYPNILALAQQLQILRDIFKCIIRVISGWRTPKKNIAVGGAADSQHPLGNAADIEVENKVKYPADKVGYYAARYTKLNGIGFGKQNTTHLDTRETWTIWKY